MSNTKQIEKSLKKLILKDDRAFVAMLSGKWGIGKTYFWKNLFEEKELKDAKISTTYISLFGYSSIQSIKNDIVLKLSKAETTKAIFSKVFQNFRTSLGSKDGDESTSLNLSGSLVSSALSLIPEKSLKGSVICFDDFERLSKKVSFEDVMGLISQFKEQKECKVILILNEGELSSKNQKIFAKKKEKIVDFSFYYQPSQKELFKIIKKDIKKITFCKDQTILDFFEKIDLKNIRIMKQSLYLLKQFSFIKSKRYDKKVIDEFVEIALNLFVFKAKSNYLYSDFKDMRGYITEEELNREWMEQDNGNSESSNIASKKDRENSSFYYDDLPYRHTNKRMEALIYDFLDNLKIDRDSVYALLNINSELIDKDGIIKEVFRLINGLLFELSEDIEQIIQKLYAVLVQHKLLIPYTIQMVKLNEYFTYIKEHHPELIDEHFIDTYILSYYDMKGYVAKGGDFSMNSYIDFIAKYYPHLQKELNEKIIKDRISKISIDTISALISRVQTGWSLEDAAILNSIDATIYMQYIEESGDFFYDIMGFIKKRGKENDFSVASQHIKDALRELKEKGNNYNWRISKLLEKHNINIEEDK